MSSSIPLLDVTVLIVVLLFLFFLISMWFIPMLFYIAEIDNRVINDYINTRQKSKSRFAARDRDELDYFINQSF